ncbi:MAG TPA: DUF4097 family beta strand repeat-containing protein [Steroidobacteraceae bacterium]|nr:DUF4097 family beta strand repeat-containing protein [Steroidobacteraceae bacterium]
MSKALQLLLAASLALAGCHVSFASDCKVTAERSGQHAVAGAKRIAITARAGDLEVQGRKGATQVNARGKACASEQRLLDLIRIELRLEGDVLKVNALMPDITADDAPDDARATLDLTLEVPDHLPIEVVDSSGDAKIDSLAGLQMTDSSGDLRISRIAGEVDVRDSSGDLWIDEVGKNVRLQDSSGDVSVEDVHGDVEVEADGSGSLVFERVDRNVTVARDGSGDIRIANVKGDARIDSDGSGDVNVRDVAGSFSLGGKGSGEVNVAEVKGAVSIPPERR